MWGVYYTNRKTNDWHRATYLTAVAATVRGGWENMHTTASTIGHCVVASCREVYCMLMSSQWHPNTVLEPIGIHPSLVFTSACCHTVTSQRALLFQSIRSMHVYVSQSHVEIIPSIISLNSKCRIAELLLRVELIPALLMLYMFVYPQSMYESCL